METSPANELSIIVVNYNTADMLNECLNSIACQSEVAYEVIVVDNDSQDNSRDIIKANFPWVNLIENKRNFGFARANNQALQSSKSKYVYFLNPDTEVSEGALQAMIDFMQSHPEVGLAGTKIINPDGSPQSSVEKRYPGEKHAKEDLKGLAGDIAWVLGASMIARRHIVEALGGFDETFFLYGEEQDLCLRVRKAGWAIGYIPDSVVVHWGGQSERNTLPINIWEKKFDSEILFYKKHYSKKAIRSIRRGNIIQALWRVFTLKLTLPLCNDKGNCLEKLDKYRLVLKTFRTKRF